MDTTDRGSDRLDLEALRALEEDAPELERLEDLLDRFNVFEAIGFVGQEVMHSRFLAFLLDPTQNHGLGAVFLKRFLREGSESTDGVSLCTDLDSANGEGPDQTTVRTEVHTGDGRIDILLLNETEEWAVLVENKVWTTEHSGQLDKYHRFVKKSYPGWWVLALYLTPFGETPSHGAYLSIGYGTVCRIIEEVLEERGSALSPDVRMSMEHYAGMVRRRILDDPEVVDLCKSMYRKHQRAFDLVYKYRPDPEKTIRDILVGLIREAAGLAYAGRHRNEYIFFGLREWEVPALAIGDDPHGYLRFVFHNHSDELVLFLETSPGDEATSRRLYEAGRKHESVFNDLMDPDTDDYPKLYKRTILAPGHFGEVSDDVREEEIRRQWAAFLEEDLPRIDKAIREEAWIWDPVEADEI